MASSFLRFLDHTQRRTTVGRTPLDEWSARRRDLYLTTHNIHNRQTSMPPVGFEPTISAGERLQTYALDRAVTGTGIFLIVFYPNWTQNLESRANNFKPLSKVCYWSNFRENNKFWTFFAKNSYTELDPKSTDGVVAYSGSQTYGQMGGQTDERTGGRTWSPH